MYSVHVFVSVWQQLYVFKLSTYVDTSVICVALAWLANVSHKAILFAN